MFDKMIDVRRKTCTIPFNLIANPVELPKILKDTFVFIRSRNKSGRIINIVLLIIYVDNMTESRDRA